MTPYTQNRYAYVGNNPINRWDPLGYAQSDNDIYLEQYDYDWVLIREWSEYYSDGYYTIKGSDGWYTYWQEIVVQNKQYRVDEYSVWLYYKNGSLADYRYERSFERLLSKYEYFDRDNFREFSAQEWYEEHKDELDSYGNPPPYNPPMAYDRIRAQFSFSTTTLVSGTETILFGTEKILSGPELVLPGTVLEAYKTGILRAEAAKLALGVQDTGILLAMVAESDYDGSYNVHKNKKPVTDKGTGNATGDKSPIGSTSEFKKKFGDTIDQLAKELGVDPDLLAAVILVESGGSGFVDGNLKIRFENHYFLDRTKGYTDLFTYYWKDHKFRTSVNEEWRTVHTGKQSSEYAAFNFAKSLNEEAAYRSISMGLGQIMGANYAACGYSSAKEMFEDFSKGHEQQIKGMATFFKNYNNGKTLKALQNGDLKSFVTQYNGDGQVEHYTKLILQRKEEYKNVK